MVGTPNALLGSRVPLIMLQHAVGHSAEALLAPGLRRSARVEAPERQLVLLHLRLVAEIEEVLPWLQELLDIQIRLVSLARQQKAALIVT